MSDVVGVLGEASTATAGTTTAYTVPSGKAAKVQFMYRGTAGVSSTLAVIVNGITIFTTGALTSTQLSVSTKTEMHKANPTLTGNGTDSVVAPAPYYFYLSEGDTVQYVIGTAAFADFKFQVVGVEVDL